MGAGTGGRVMNEKEVTISFIITVLVVITLSLLSYTIINQQKQIEQLQQQLQHEQMKYKVIINDPLVRDAMEAGG